MRINLERSSYFLEEDTLKCGRRLLAAKSCRQRRGCSSNIGRRGYVGETQAVVISCNLPRNEDPFPVRAYRVSRGELTGESFPQENLGSLSWLSIKRFGKSLVKSENILLDGL